MTQRDGSVYSPSVLKKKIVRREHLEIKRAFEEMMTIEHISPDQYFQHPARYFRIFCMVMTLFLLALVFCFFICSS
jgi:hypothetical protein